MAKITISQLQTADANNIQELTNTELDTTKGGLDLVLPVTVADVAIAGQNKPQFSDNFVLNDVLRNVLIKL
ncbi:hypothetical protein F7734_51565 [Scytonema sp. UIC 10036]|uniref:hypothetical protein n=1 Tax=Scytonema sp. UIC 10036 TaxID=2304196 RepID=UPI0012DA8FE7|nr:hypothetical protein [Scytonema sp. UIC 10036]MUH00268.1 hypothetical protein [Scytonema sp. UIC 10036]